MDLIALDQFGREGRIVNGFDSLTWTERYRLAGDFKLSASLDPKLMDMMPIGSYVTHINTREIMEVQDYSIKKERGKTPTLSITGRSFETFLEQRAAAPNTGGLNIRSTDAPNKFALGKASSWKQAWELIERNLTGPWPGGTLSTGDKVLHVNAIIDIVGLEPVRLGRIFERGNVYERVIELLAVSNCGIKTRRPYTHSGTIDIIIYQGQDRSSTINISAKLDELDSAEYFVSNRQEKNCAFVCGKYDGLTYIPEDPRYAHNPSNKPEGMERRWIYVDASDIEDEGDGEYNEQLLARAKDALDTNNRISLVDPDISSANVIKYGVDYDLGDTIMVSGDFGAQGKMRVDEFTWSFDQTGEFGHPTLTPVESE